MMDELFMKILRTPTDHGSTAVRTEYAFVEEFENPNMSSFPQVMVSFSISTFISTSNAYISMIHCNTD